MNNKTYKDMRLSLLAALLFTFGISFPGQAKGDNSSQTALTTSSVTPDGSQPPSIENLVVQADPVVPNAVSPDSENAETSIIAQEPPATDPRVLVAEVQVQGVEGELEDVVYRAIQTQPGRTTTRSQLQEDVNAVFATGLFQNVRVEPEDTPLGVRITFLVEPNPVLQNVEVQTVPAAVESRVLPPEVVNEIFGEQYGQVLNLRDLQEDIKQLNEWYRERGYDLAQVVGAPEVSPDGVVTLLVAEGVIEDIRVRYFDEDDEEADGRTREFIITRELQLEPGDVFNRDLARRDLQRVFGLGLFDDVRLSFDPAEDPTQVIVNVDVVERNTGSIAAGAGISSASGLFGTVSYSEQNLGGNDQNVTGELQVGQRELLFNARYTDPWIAGDPYRTSYSVEAFRRRSISLIFEGDEENITIDGDRPRVVRTGAGVTFARPLAPDVFSKADWVVSAGLEYQRVAIQDGDGDIVDDEIEPERFSFSNEGVDDLVLLELAAVRDFRDNALQPSSGSLLRLSVDQSVPIGAGSILLNRLRGSYSYYLPVDYLSFQEDKPEVFAFNLQAGTIFGDLPPYEAFSLGGSNSVRSFEEGQLGTGRSYVQATAEYRFPVLGFINGVLFLDYATDLGTADDVPGAPAILLDKPGSGFGYGVGVRVQSPLGPIRVDYAFGEGDNRIHFGIGERF